jgi:hypothetical protein
MNPHWLQGFARRPRRWRDRPGQARGTEGSAGHGVYQIGLPFLRATERQGPLGAGIRHKAGKTGEPVPANKFVFKHHQIQAGRPPASRAAASASQSARSA